LSGPSIKVIRDFYSIRITINDLLHVHVKVDDLLAVHSWLKPKPSIEYVLRGGSFVTEYDSREKLDMILCGLEGAL
jgi:hypothetical protein